MSQSLYFGSFVVLGLVISLVVRALRADDIGTVWAPAGWSFVKLAGGSIVAILLVELLYIEPIITYPVLVVLIAWMVMGDRLWQRKKASRSQE